MRLREGLALSGKLSDNGGVESLLDYVQRELPRHLEASSVRELAESAGVGVSWLAKFAAGKIPDPRVQRLEKLAAYLRERERVVA